MQKTEPIEHEPLYCVCAMLWPRVRKALSSVPVVILASVAGAVCAYGQETQPPLAPAPPAWKITGLVFGDYYYFAQNHDEKFDGQKGFWLRRAFFTYDHTLAPSVAMRFRLEVNSDGKMAGGGNLTPFLKDAYLRWTYRRGHQAILGIQPTPTVETVDAVWGLRHIERTPADLYRFDTTRDLGVGFTGALNSAGTARYSAQVANDSGTTSETDGRMAVRLAARYDTDPGIFVEGSYWHADREAGDRKGFQAFAAYRQPRGRAGVHYVRHEREGADGRESIETSVLSVFGVAEILPRKASAFARVDKVFDPLPDGNIDYLPISTVSPFTFGLVGVEYRLLPMVSFSPNLEFVHYGSPRRPGSLRPRHDVVARASFYWVW